MKRNACAGLLVWILAPIISAQTKNWPQFRGAQADGLGEGATLPDTWSTTENVVWKTDLPGWGWSSPVIWDKRIFVTATNEHRWMTFCLDFDTGKILLELAARKDQPGQMARQVFSQLHLLPSPRGEPGQAVAGKI